MKRIAPHPIYRGVRCKATPIQNIQTNNRKPKYAVVVTGGTKGVGLSLAKEFLKEGDAVTICSRQEQNVKRTVEELQGTYGNAVTGQACDVSKAEEVRSFAKYAMKQHGHIDIWINNAGTNAYQFKPLVESSVDDLREIVETNTLGLMYCMKESMEIMKNQEGMGHIFNMDGAGASGSATPRFAAYGATKRGLVQLNKSLKAELDMVGIDNIALHMLSPGMVTTELLMAGSDTKIAKFMINALAERPEDVATFLVPRIREVVSLGSKAGSSYIKYLTLPKAYSQILMKAVFGIRKNRYIQE